MTPRAAHWVQWIIVTASAPHFQVGADVPLGGNWYANVDAKKVFISTTAKFSSGVRADVDIDPLILGAGIGYHF